VRKGNVYLHGHWQINALWVEFGLLTDFLPLRALKPLQVKWFAHAADVLSDLGWEQQPGHNV